MALKNFGFLIPHLPEFEGELKELLLEIDKLIEKKRVDWENELGIVEQKLSLKVAENVELQKQINEMKPSPESLLTLKSDLCENNCAVQLDMLKAKVDNMSTRYDSLKRKYQQQSDRQDKQHIKTVTAVRKENLAMKIEIDHLRQNNCVELETLKTRLNEERENSCRLAEHCRDIQFRLESTVAEHCEQLSQFDALKIAHQRQENQFQVELAELSKTISSQNSEIKRLKQILSEKQSHLRCLSDQSATRESELRASKLVVRRLEKAVNRHLSMVHSSVQPATSPTQNHLSPESSPPGQRVEICTPDEINEKLKSFEIQLNEAHGQLTEKMSQVYRLESACQTASQTIQRLVRTRSHYSGKLAAMAKLWEGSVAIASQLSNRVSELEKTLMSGLINADEKVRQLGHKLRMHSINALRLLPKSMYTTSVQTMNNMDAVNRMTQTDGDSWLDVQDVVSMERFRCLERTFSDRVEELHGQVNQLSQERADLQHHLNYQTSVVKQLQEENLALSDMLTGAESFNRTRLPCATEMPHVLASAFVDIQPHDQRNHSEQPIVSATHQPHRRTPVGTTKSVNFLLSADEDCHSKLGAPTAAPLCGLPPLSASHHYLHSPPTCLQNNQHRPLISPVPTKPRVSPRHQPSSPPNRVTLNSTSCDYSPPLEMDCTPVASPSEYGDFVLNFTSSATTADLGKCVPFTIPPSYSIPRTNGTRHSSAHSLSPKYNRPHEEELCVNSLDNESSPLHHSTVMQQPADEVEQRTCEMDTYSKFATDLAGTDDVSVFSLAAKFLADEQQHSALLEQRIDAHLEALKSRVVDLATASIS